MPSSSLAALVRAARTILERADHQIDKAWIDGIRKGWKQLVAQAKDYPDRVLVDGSPMDAATLDRAVTGAVAYVKFVRDYVRRLREDLLILKGFWTEPDPKAGATTIRGMKTKVIAELDAAEAVLTDVKRYAKSFREDPHHYDLFRSQKDFDFGVRGIGNRVEAAVAEADKAISGRLFRLLSTLVGKTAKAGEPLDFGGYAETEVSVGKAKLIFRDTPVNPTAMPADALDTKKARHPMKRERYIALFREAQALLARRGLAALWYGTFEIFPRADDPVELYRKAGGDYANLTGVDANYHRRGDKVQVWSGPKDALVKTIVHELGHRHYFKFLTPAARRHFDQWFNAVPAATTYGKTNSAEDYAEVFAAYVMGRDLTRDQIDRFKSVLDPKAHRTESRVDQMRALLGA